MKFTDEHKKEMLNKYFGYGVHKVQITTFDLGKTDSGKEYIEVFFADPDDLEREDSVRVWFSTDKGSNFSFNVLKSIYVHNAPEAKKDAARASFDKLTSTEEMVDLLNEKLGGGEMWFTKYLDPNNTYTGNDGIERQSVNKSVYGWEPELKPELMPKKAEETGITEDAVKATFPDAQTVESEPDPTDKWGNN